MKITVELPEEDLKDIMRFSGEKKKGPAITKFLASVLMLRRRRELSDEAMSGKFRAEFPNWEEMRRLDREGNPWNTSCITARPSSPSTAISSRLEE